MTDPPRYRSHTAGGMARNPETHTDMPTFQNQKEESLTTEARRADNRARQYRGPKG